MRKVLFSVLIAIVIGIGLLHFFTPAYLAFYHDTYRRLSYFPIVLGAIWFGAKGGFILALLSSIAFIPHVLLFMGQDPQTYLSELMEIVLYLAAGTVTGFIAQREAKLREQYKVLSEKLEKSYRRLHKQAKILLEVEEQLGDSQRLSALGRLSASLAHEIKNPLSSIRGTAEIFLDEFPDGHPKREFAEILVKEAGRLNKTVEDVLKYSKGKPASAGAQEPVCDVIARVTKLLETHLRKKKIELIEKGRDEGREFFIDGGRLSQVLLNIALNSVDALPSEGGRIWLETKNDQQGLKIIICDNGPGIPEEQQNSVFDAFITTKEEGTGLGLPISRKIIESYGGTLKSSVADEGGACFTIFLPHAKKMGPNGLLAEEDVRP